MLLTEYCVNVTYYLYLKSKRTPLDSTHVVERLIKLRVILERAAPIERKLQYQIDKLLSDAPADEALTARPDVGELQAMTSADGMYRPGHVGGRALAATDTLEPMRKQRAERQEAVDDDLDAPEEVVFGRDAEDAAAEDAVRAYEEEMRTRVRKGKQKRRKDDLDELEEFVLGLADDLTAEYNAKRLGGHAVDDGGVIASDDGDAPSDAMDEEIPSDD